MTNPTPDSMPAEYKEQALRVNGLIMAMHTDDLGLFEHILTEDPDEAVGLLVGSMATLKTMVDTLIDTLHAYVEDIDVTFEKLIAMNADFLISYNEEETG